MGLVDGDVNGYDPVILSEYSDKAKFFEPYIKILTAVRKKHNLSQTRVSEDAGYGQKYVALVETRARIPSLEGFIAISAYALVPRQVIENLVEEYIDHFEWNRREQNDIPAK